MEEKTTSVDDDACQRMPLHLLYHFLTRYRTNTEQSRLHNSDCFSAVSVFGNLVLARCLCKGNVQIFSEGNSNFLVRVVLLVQDRVIWNAWYCDVTHYRRFISTPNTSINTNVQSKKENVFTFFFSYRFFLTLKHALCWKLLVLRTVPRL